MSIKDEHEREVRELNDQLYSAYKRIKTLNEQVDSLTKDLKGTVELIAQADTDGILYDRHRRFKILVNDAKSMTKKYGFFNYWDKHV